MAVVAANIDTPRMLDDISLSGADTGGLLLFPILNPVGHQSTNLKCTKIYRFFL